MVSHQDQAASSEWIPLVEFAARRGISLSTLRRYIKADKIEYRLENGRYLLKDDARKGKPSVTRGSAGAMGPGAGATADDERARRLETELNRARQEIAELKTLIALYEEKFPNSL